MKIEIVHLIIACVAATIVCTIILKPIRNYALQKNIVDSPNLARKVQIKPVPYLGGIGIFLTILFFIVIGITTLEQSNLLVSLSLNVFVPASLMLIVGLVDDLFELSASRKLLLQSAVSIFAAFLLVSKETIGSLFFSQELNLLLSIFWILIITNSINLLDNSDGIAGGVLAISTLSCGAIAFFSGQVNIAGLSVVISGACFGFLFWNRFPARIYLGDAGSLFLGILLAVITIRLTPERVDNIFSPFIVLFIVAIPILDTLLVIFSRIQRGLSPMVGGRDHVAHRLRLIGYSQNKVMTVLFALCAYFNLSALVLFFFAKDIGHLVIVINMFVLVYCFSRFWKLSIES